MKQYRNPKKAVKLISYVIAAIMAVGVLGLSPLGMVKVRADGPAAKNVNLNIGNSIAGIGVPTSTGSDAVKWEGSKVYIGNRLWRVLDPYHASTGVSGHAFLFSEDLLATIAYHNQWKNITWAECDLRKYLNGTDNNGGLFSTIFTENEKRAIAVLSITNPDNTDVSPSTEGGDDTEDRLFSLSISEARYTPYGFGSQKTRADADGNDTSNLWWLRSSGSEKNAATVHSQGMIGVKGVMVSIENGCVRPAFNLKLSSILFTTACRAGKSSSFAATTAAPASEEDNYNTWNLTLHDGNSVFAASRVPTETGSVEAGTFMHLNVTNIGEPVSPSEVSYNQLSAMLVDGNDTVVAYGKIADSVAVTPDITVKIPRSVPVGDYTLRVFAEEVNSLTSSNETDYASNMAEIPVTVTEARYSYNTPEPVTVNGLTASVSYNYDSPQLKSTNVTATVTLSGTAERAGAHSVTLKSTKGTIDLPIYQYLTENEARIGAAAYTESCSFTVGEEDIEDIKLTHTFAPDTYLMEVTPKSTDFGSKQVGYTLRPGAQSITIENKEAVSLTNIQIQSQAPAESSYEIGSATSSIAPREEKSFTIQPKSDLPIGTYYETFVITAEPEGKVEPITITASFEVTELDTYTLSVQNGTGSGSYKKGEAVTVSANVPAGKEFKQWKVTRGNLTLSDIYQAILHFFMPQEDIALSAEFRDADPNPDPTPNPAPTEPSDNGEHRSHTCDFHWVTVKNATSSADGEEVYQCSVCGDITARQAISAYGSYNKEILEKIKNAKQGETLEFSTDTWMSFPAYILKALEERPDITLIVTFRYEGKHYSFTIPARKVGGKDNVLTETDPVTGEIVNWYGFLYLSEKYGRNQVD